MPSYNVVTFGCQMNVHDSDRMHEVLRANGYLEAASPDSADVVVLNTCSIREKAVHKVRSEVGRLAVIKRQRGDLTIVVAGCVAQQEGEKLLKQIPAIDLVLGPDNIPELPALLADITTGALPQARTVFDLDDPKFLMAEPSLQGSVSPTTFVTIMKGCDERCSYCIVPYTRGAERYRSSDEIVQEISHLVEMGVREVTLLGQTVNSYRDPLQLLSAAPDANPSDPDESEFAALLWRIAKEVPGLLRLRYTSPHPRHVTASLIRAHRELPTLAKHVHMPVQSGSDRMLKRMIRRYRRDEFVQRARALQEARPGLTLSTDIIVGVCGETDEEAQATVDLIKEVGFVGVFGFKYSPRPYTPALKLEDDISEAEKGRRLARVFEVSEQLIAEHLKALVDTEQQVLVEGKSKQGQGLWSGRSERNEIVHIAQAADIDLVGQLVPVTIRRANKHSLEGTLADSFQPSAPPLAAAMIGKQRRVLPVLSESTLRKIMALIVPFRGVVPKVHPTAFVAENATLIGQVEIGPYASIWYGCVLRADDGAIRIGARSNIQDLSCIHLTQGYSETIVGEDVTVGHQVMLHGCTIADRCLIGMGSTLLDLVEIAEDSVVGACSLVTARKVFPARSMIKGSPAVRQRECNDNEARLGLEAAKHYVTLAAEYLSR
jgi:tRNA-2-methylthio-N6-dimethylallyladenosine synthase